MPTIEEVLEEHVALEIESVDRVYLNLCVPRLQHSSGIYSWLHDARGLPIPSPAMLGKIGGSFVKEVEHYARDHGIPLEALPRGKRKEEYARPFFEAAMAQGRSGVVFIGTAQERARSYRGVITPQGKQAGQPWFEFRSAEVFVKWFYFYILDPEFGPCFLKQCTYAPFTGRLYVNGHEWAKQQLRKAGIGYQALDNGFLSVEQPERLQQICERFGPDDIHALFRRWQAALPQPFTDADRAAGFDYRISVLQAEISLTLVFHQPRYGRLFFEQAIRDHLDLGRPDQVSLLFQKRVTRRTPGIFRTRVVQVGVNPTIQALYKHTAVKQYFKEGRALRTETTINDTYDIGVQRGLGHLPELIRFGRDLNRRLLTAERASATCLAQADKLEGVFNPTVVDGQRVPALRFGDPRTFALQAALCLFAFGPLAPGGFRAFHLRDVMPHLNPGNPYSSAQASYDLRRLRHKGFISAHKSQGTGARWRRFRAAERDPGLGNTSVCRIKDQNIKW